MTKRRRLEPRRPASWPWAHSIVLWEVEEGAVHLTSNNESPTGTQPRIPSHLESWGVCIPQGYKSCVSQ